MYIGYHSPTHLHSFLSGFSFATNFQSSEIEQPNFNDFHDWIAKRLNYYESTSGWAHMIEDQREDKEEALWLFFELLDEFRGISHEVIYSIDYFPHYKLDTSWRGYSRQKKVRGTFKAVPKPRPTTLIIRKMNLDESWYSLIALNEKNEILDIRTSTDLGDMYKWGLDIYDIGFDKWK